MFAVPLHEVARGRTLSWARALPVSRGVPSPATWAAFLTVRAFRWFLGVLAVTRRPSCEQAFECPQRPWNPPWNPRAVSLVRSGHCVQSARRIGAARRLSATNRAYGKEKVYGSIP
jgi:hypothetical protein